MKTKYELRINLRALEGAVLLVLFTFAMLGVFGAWR
jgi:hypothetical protein